MLARCALGLMAALVGVAILSSCAQSPNLPREEVSCVASTIHARWRTADPATLQIEHAVQELWQQKRYNEIYTLLLPYAQQGDPWIQETIGDLLSAGLVDGTLVEGVPPDERARMGIVWTRRAAYHCEDSAIGRVSWLYKFGRLIIPEDAELSECFRRARKDVTHLSECQQMEIEKGYVEQP